MYCYLKYKSNRAIHRQILICTLSYVGFTQSHCYFPWRNTKEELETHLVEDEELGLRSEGGGVGDTGGLQVGLGLAGNLTRAGRIRRRMTRSPRPRTITSGLRNPDSRFWVRRRIRSLMCAADREIGRAHV